MIQPEIEPADQGQTLIAIASAIDRSNQASAIDRSNQVIASCAPVFGRRRTVSQDENVLFASRSACEAHQCGGHGCPALTRSPTLVAVRVLPRSWTREHVIPLLSCPTERSPCEAVCSLGF